MRTRSRFATDDIDTAMHAVLQGIGVAYSAQYTLAKVRAFADWMAEEFRAFAVDPQEAPVALRLFLPPRSRL